MFSKKQAVKNSTNVSNDKIPNLPNHTIMYTQAYKCRHLLPGEGNCLTKYQCDKCSV